MRASDPHRCTHCANGLWTHVRVDDIHPFPFACPSCLPARISRWARDDCPTAGRYELAGGGVYDFTPIDADRVARLAHAGQKDKAGLPYITHPRRVAARLDDPVLQLIALLHDVVEDTAWMLDDLHRYGVPGRVLLAVEVLTHPRGEPNEVYWARVRGNEDARQVKLADVADNSDPDRLDYLDDATRERLVRKYQRAAAALTAA